MVTSFACQYSHFLSAFLQGGKMLRPEKWNACFDTEGRVTGFHKTLKFIVLGVSSLTDTVPFMLERLISSCCTYAHLRQIIPG
jgi:hypothetical protein